MNSVDRTAARTWVAIRGVACALALWAAPAHADDRPPSARSYAKVDLDDLEAYTLPGPDAWIVRVRYNIEVENARPGERFDLVVRFPPGLLAPLPDPREPAPDPQELQRRDEIVILLDRPTKIKDDEIEFDQAVDLRMPADLGPIPQEFPIGVAVYPAGGGYPLAQDDAKVEPYEPKIHRYPRHGRAIHIRVERHRYRY